MCDEQLFRPRRIHAVFNAIRAFEIFCGRGIPRALLIADITAESSGTVAGVETKDCQ